MRFNNLCGKMCADGISMFGIPEMFDVYGRHAICVQDGIGMDVVKGFLCMWIDGLRCRFSR